MSEGVDRKKRYVIRGGAPLRGTTRVPADKSIAHRALIFAALADGRSIIRGFAAGRDNLATAEIVRRLGVRVEIDGETARVDGVGLDGLTMPTVPLDCENSGTTMRLLAGVLAGQRFGARLVGDASLSGRPMMRVVGPLRARGAHIAGVRGKKDGEQYPPLSIAPLISGERLIALEYRSPIASAQVKSCLLLSGLYADGLTAIAEPIVSRDHTERAMRALGIPLETMGPMMVLDPTGWSRRWDGFEWTVPGDPSSAAFVIAAALLVPGSEVTVEGVGINPTRTGLFDALRAMRARLDVSARGEAGCEPIGELGVRAGSLAATNVGGELLTRMIDEVPVFAAIASLARGRSDVRDASELRVKESDRLATIARVLAAFGADVTELDDGLHVHGTRKLLGAHVASEGDHRIAMSAAVLGMAAEGETVVDDVACVETSFPGFAEQFVALGADLRVEDVP
ncbi:MAG: 3-phosphoshikimate 1-carboxyvinyltransferase [Sandaracinaceae bacterium]